MLESLRKWASGWVAFIMIALLILSFAIWGISDYITGGAGGNALATVGSKQITSQEFQREFGNELNQLSRQAGQRITYEQARAVGLDSRVLSQMIRSTAVEAHADELNLALSDSTLAAGLAEDPNFQSAGRFDRNLVLRLQQELDLTERGLLDLRRKDELRNQITTALLRSTVVPDEMIDALAQWRGETRVISHFTIDPEKLPPLAEPSEADLKKTYEENKSRFMTDPRRDLAVLYLSLNDLKAKAELTDDEIRKAFEQSKSVYEVPEKREIEQISFKDKAAAEKALAEIKAGKDFFEVAKENGAEASDVKLGLKAKGDHADKKIDEAAFKLVKDEVSSVIEGDFTTVIVRVAKIEPGKIPTYDEVKDKVRGELAAEWANVQIQDLYGKIDDGRAEGKSLADIAADVGVPFFDIKGVTRGNVAEGDKPGLTVPDASSIISQGFRGEIGLEGEPMELKDGGYFWVDVKNIKDAEQRPFEDVQAEVKRYWTTEKTRTRILDAAAKFLADLKSGTDFAKVAEEAGGKVDTTAAVGRSTIPDGMSQSAMTQAFTLKTGEFGNAETSDGKSRTLFRVDEIKKSPDPSVEQRQQFKDEIQQQLRTDSIAAYVEALQERYGVDINQTLFNRVTGADQAGQ
ncbi:MAG: SurA N-terminal domain-containing protein [Alphaproteobacteria bacterium]|nr:SurA N-terminal domain-containing protein [Alphaproteobacteria bacterium]